MSHIAYGREPLEQTPSRPSVQEMKTLVDGGNRFAFDLYGKLRDRDGNLFFSPGSISLALAMTSAGATGATRDEMVRTLHFPPVLADLDQGMRALLAAWGSNDAKQGYRLRVANRLWAPTGLRVPAGVPMIGI